MCAQPFIVLWLVSCSDVPGPQWSYPRSQSNGDCAITYNPCTPNVPKVVYSSVSNRQKPVLDNVWVTRSGLRVSGLLFPARQGTPSYIFALLTSVTSISHTSPSKAPSCWLIPLGRCREKPWKQFRRKHLYDARLA